MNPRGNVLAWFVMALAAAALFGAAVLWAGGVSEVQRLAAQEASTLREALSPSTKPRTPVPPTAAAKLPQAAQQLMFARQAADNQVLGDLAVGRIASLTFGAVSVSGDTATVDATVAYNGGNAVPGVVTLARVGGTWYIFGLALSRSATSSPDVPIAFDPGVASTLAREQALPGSQETIAQGLLGGGLHVLTVDSTSPGPRTVTVGVTLTGGSAKRSRGRLVLVSMAAGGKTYWFVARFEKL